MNLADYFPIWNKLTPQQQSLLTQASTTRQVPRGTVIHNGSMDCLGLILVCSGLLRAYILSEEGREVTIYRLFERDICLLSASCIIQSIQFEVTVEAEKDSEIIIIRPEVYRSLMEESAPVANYTNQLMASRFSEVMWLIEQIMWKSFDQRLASFLLEESALEGSDTLSLTHETISKHLGTAREVVTRMLRYFQSEGLIQSKRGAVEIIDGPRLQKIAEK